MSRRAASLQDLAQIRAAAPPETAVLTLEQVAAWLQIGCAKVLEMKLRCFDVDGRLRFVARQVLADLEARAERAA